MLSSLFKGGKKFSIVTFCNFGVQITSLFFFTIIARLFEPEILGEYLIYLAYVSIIVILSTGFYEQALFIDKKDHRQGYIVVAVLSVALCISFCAYIPMSIFSPDYAVFVCLSVLAGATRVIARTYGIVNGRLIQIAIYDLLLSPILPLFIVFGAKYFEIYTSLYLISTNALVTFITNLLLLLYVVRLNRFKLVYSLKHSIYLSILILRRYINLPKYKMTAELVGIFTLRLPTFAIDRFFSANLAAFYGVAFRIVIVPVSVITSTVAQMFLYKIRYNLANSLNTYNVFIKYSLLLAGIAILSIVSIFIFADWLVVKLFTDKYSDVSHILKLLSPYLAVLILVSPLMGTFIVYEKQRYLLVMKLNLLVMTTLGYMFAVFLDDIDYGFMIFSLSSILVYGHAYLAMYKHYKNELSNSPHSLKE